MASIVRSTSTWYVFADLFLDNLGHVEERLRDPAA
jgi:hypothetical protein